MMKTPHSPTADSGSNALDTSSTELESMMQKVEAELAALGEALRQHDGLAIEDHAQQLQRALELAVDGFTLAARSGSIPPPLRSRLAQAGRRVAAQRESLARATIALDRAIDTLLPRDQSPGYGAGRWFIGNA
jgi:hypothetical protein